MNRCNFVLDPCDILDYLTGVSDRAFYLEVSYEPDAGIYR